MTLPSPDFDDLALLADAARAAGALLKSRFGEPVKTWSKGAAGPVTEVDLAVDALLKERLRGARPDYGWLSEETTDTSERLAARRIFIVDPLDGTIAFLKGWPEFCVSIAVAEEGAAVAGVVFNPITDQFFAAWRGGGATCNGAPVSASGADQVEGARMIGSAAFYGDARWPIPWPPVSATKVHALAYRLALIAGGAHDGLVALGFKNDWDLAAGALLVEEAGGRVTDPFGAPFRFNQPLPRQAGAVAAGRSLHPLLIDRVRLTPHPATLERRQPAGADPARDDKRDQQEGQGNA